MICTQLLFPKRHRIVRNGEADRGHLPAPAGASSRSGPGEKGNDGSRTPDVIAKIKMVAPGIVEMHCPLDQTQPERLAVRVEIALRISRDRGDVMDGCAGRRCCEYTPTGATGDRNQVLVIQKGNCARVKPDGRAVANYAQSPENQTMSNAFGKWNCSTNYSDEKANPVQCKALAGIR